MHIKTSFILSLEDAHGFAHIFPTYGLNIQNPFINKWRLCHNS